MNKTHGLWGIAALAALSLTACGGGDMRYGDGTMTGGTESTPSYDSGVTNGNAYDNATNGNAYHNATNGSAYDNATNGNAYDNRTDRDGVTDFGDTTRRTYDNGDTERSMLEKASDALENGVQRARDGLDSHS